MSSHPRNTGPMISSPRCGAKTCNGDSCRAPAVAGKARCRMHGGAPGSGAPPANQNAFKHGAFGKEVMNIVNAARRLRKEAAETRKKLGL